ncbi:hypothetical protein UCRPC4_g00175 [Phaeomoniella chlamydospora]|uniref:Uncharacterized protein n=1 Tax=Phaeomoniella chlamydospora TaxID=158046 RepID=A0A0G2H1D1_PHACM|nr:hypothetical protein UCRPC4_g00175 [Phaeomoniella chlamydospora]
MRRLPALPVEVTEALDEAAEVALDASEEVVVEAAAAEDEAAAAEDEADDTTDEIEFATELAAELAELAAELNADVIEPATPDAEEDVGKSVKAVAVEAAVAVDGHDAAVGRFETPAPPQRLSAY